MSTGQEWSVIWQGSHPPISLRLMAGLYAFGWRLYEGLYRFGWRKRVQMPVPVIGVGSLLVGGTGKTPGAIAIARLLKRLGSKPVVLCNGYGGRRWNRITVLEPGMQPDPYEVGEESILLLQALQDTPVVVGRKRVQAAQIALQKFHPDLLLLDDGFQHLPLARDLDLVLLDAEAPFSNGYCLPAGALREPVSGLKRASAVILVFEESGEHAGEAGRLTHWPLPIFQAYRRSCGVYRLQDGSEIAAETLRGLSVVTLCGIARPDRFERAVQRLGVHIETRLRFPDHHPYTPNDVSTLPFAKPVLTTEKDAVKLKPLLSRIDSELYVLRSRIEYEPAFEEWLSSTLAAKFFD